MSKVLSSYLTIIFFVFVLIGCNSCNENKEIIEDQSTIKERLEEGNKRNAAREKEEIDSYIKEKKWSVESTGTGLQYYVYEQGSGDFGKLDQMASIHYSIYLLNDTLLYSSEDKEAATFRIGQSTVETGLHEAVQLLRVGDKAKLFLPSHLAHGAFGDQKKIPPQTPLLYDVELVDLK